jgi:hypothetical protein
MQNEELRIVCTRHLVATCRLSFMFLFSAPNNENLCIVFLFCIPNSEFHIVVL